MYNNKMREIRKQEGITLSRLSEMTSISVGYLCHLEKGTRKNPSIKVMDKISMSLGKSVSDIFFR